MVTKWDINSVYWMNSGYYIPVLGFGVYRTYIDSAAAYGNERPCGDAIRVSGIPREQIFFTTKVPSQALGYEKSKASIEKSIKEGGVDYYDLILIHAPYGTKEDRLGSWRALVEAKKAGKVRSIGVSNYGVHHLEELKEYIQNGGGGSIDVGQYELHPWLARPDIVDWLNANKVVIQAYCPLVRAVKHDDPLIKKLAEKHDRTPAQILLRWSLQKGFVPLPKSVTPSRIEENAQFYDFELDKGDMEALNTGEYSPVAWDPTKDTQV